MKNDSIKPVPGQPFQYTIWKLQYGAKPLLHLFINQKATHWAENIHQLMLLVELNSLADNLDRELMYELYFDLRRLLEAFRESLLNAADDEK